MSARIYLDNAATTPIKREVIDAMTACLEEHYGNPSSIHTEGRKVRALLEKARKTVAHAIGASLGEIFFTSGGTEANNMAIKCAVRDLGVRHIISSKLEHHCVLHSLDTMERTEGVQIHYADNDAIGKVDLNSIENILKNIQDKTLVSIMHANNEIGTLNDIEAIGSLCQQYGALFHSDTVQTIGHYPFDLSKLHIDFLSGAAHKFHGPKGVGFIYISNRNQIAPFIDGGAQERNMRGGTENVYGIVGLAKAMELAYHQLDKKIQYIQSLKDRLSTGLKDILPGTLIQGDKNGLYTVLNIAFPPHEKSEMMLMLMDIHGISASGGSACSSGSEKVSHVVAAIGTPPGYRAVRFSFSDMNNMEEIDQTIAVMENILAPVKSAVPC